MNLMVIRCFPKADKVYRRVVFSDPIHAEKQAYAVQEIWIKYRRQVLNLENEAIQAGKEAGLPNQSEVPAKR